MDTIELNPKNIDAIEKVLEALAISFRGDLHPMEWAIACEQYGQQIRTEIANRTTNEAAKSGIC